MCLDKQNNNFAHSAQFFGRISLPSVHDHDVNLPIFKFCWGRVTRQRFSNSSFKLGYNSVEFDSSKINQYSKNWTTWNISDEFWKRMNSLFTRSFHLRRRRRCLTTTTTSLFLTLNIQLPGRSKTMQKRYPGIMSIIDGEHQFISVLRYRKESRFGAWMLGLRSSLELCLSWNNFKIPPPKFLINDTAKDANTIFEASLSLP